MSNISYSSTSAQNLPSLGSLTSQFMLNKIKRDTSDFLTSAFSDIQKSDKSTMSVYSFEEPDLSEEPFTIISPENKISSGSTIEKISKDQFFSNSSKRDYNGSLKNSSTKGIHLFLFLTLPFLLDVYRRNSKFFFQDKTRR